MIVRPLSLAGVRIARPCDTGTNAGAGPDHPENLLGSLIFRQILDLVLGRIDIDANIVIAFG